MFIRRLGTDTSRLSCASGRACPDVLELENGDLAVIGADITAVAVGQLPEGSGCAESERVVRIPRDLFLRAHADLQAAR